MKTTIRFSLVMAALAMVFVLATGSAWAAPQTTCPVMGGPIDKTVYTDYKGQRVYFCCASCIDEFKKSPEKYLEIIKKNGQTPEPAPQSK